MTIGFLSGVAVNIIAGQLADLTGADAEGSVAVQKAWDVLTHPGRIELASRVSGAAAMVLIVLLVRTRVAAFGAVVALVVPTVIVGLAGADVAQVRDQGNIPRGIPVPAWPEWSAFSLSLVAGARSRWAAIFSGCPRAAPTPWPRRQRRLPHGRRCGDLPSARDHPADGDDSRASDLQAARKTALVPASRRHGGPR